jgi:hypothetical protein
MPIVSKYCPRTTPSRTTGVRTGVPRGVSGVASPTLPSPLIGMYEIAPSRRTPGTAAIRAIRAS